MFEEELVGPAFSIQLSDDPTLGGARQDQEVHTLRESSLSTIHWSESTYHRDDFSGLALRHALVFRVQAWLSSLQHSAFSVHI